MNNEQIKQITGNITPLNWEAGEDVEKDLFIVYSNILGEICKMTRKKEGEANIKYLVKACNSYPTLITENEKLKALNSELVEALEELMRFEAAMDLGADRLQHPDNFLNAIEKAKELINKAKKL